jgi:hypothetical protein
VSIASEGSEGVAFDLTVTTQNTVLTREMKERGCVNALGWGIIQLRCCDWVWSSSLLPDVDAISRRLGPSLDLLQGVSRMV